MSVVAQVNLEQNLLPTAPLFERGSTRYNSTGITFNGMYLPANVTYSDYIGMWIGVMS